MKYNSGMTTMTITRQGDLCCCGHVYLFHESGICVATRDLYQCGCWAFVAERELAAGDEQQHGEETR